MWVEWTPGAEAVLAGSDATIESAGRMIALPGCAASIALLRDLLVEPKPLQELEQGLSQAFPQARTGQLLAGLVNEQVLSFCEFATDLGQLQQETTKLGSYSANPVVPSDGGMMRRQISGSRVIALPRTAHLKKTLEETLLGRRSCWTFSGAPVSLEELGTILFSSAAAGSNGPAIPKATGAPAANRAYPSAGALYPVEILIYASKVLDVPPAFYYYQALGHKLSVQTQVQLSGDALPLPFEQPADRAGFFVLFFIDFLRQTLRKYGPKMYRLALIEAGHIAQNLVLASEAMNLACLPICGFDDSKICEKAALRYPEQPVVYALAVGKRGSSDLHA